MLNKGGILALLASGIIAACAWYLWTFPSASSKAKASAQPQGEVARSDVSVDALPISAVATPIRTDPVADALALSYGLPRVQALELSGYDLALSSVEEAFARLSKITDVADRAAMVRGIFSAAAQLDVHDAISLVKRLNRNDGEYTVALQTLAESWRGGEPYNPAGVYIGSDRPRGLDTDIARWLAQKRPEAAEAWAKELLTYSKSRAAVLEAAFAAYPEFGTPQMPARLRTMLSQMSAEEQIAFNEQLDIRLHSSPFNARNWVPHLPPGELRTQFMVEICRIFGNAPDKIAKETYNRIPQGEGRAEAIASLAKSWWARDQRSATAWAASLAPDERTSATAGFQSAAAGRE